MTANTQGGRPSLEAEARGGTNTGLEDVAQVLSNDIYAPVRSQVPLIDTSVKGG